VFLSFIPKNTLFFSYSKLFSFKKTENDLEKTQLANGYRRYFHAYFFKDELKNQTDYFKY
jgi:hypothetical protein